MPYSKPVRPARHLTGVINPEMLVKRLMLSALFLAAIASPAFAKGPPWISIEFRANYATFLLARTFHHGTPMPLPLSGTAEGLVNGRRLSVPLQFVQEGETNGYDVPQTWGHDGVWVLNIGVDSSDHGTAGAVVGVDRSGQSAFVRFPRSRTGFSRKATSGEVDALLRALDEGRQPPALSGSGFPFLARAVLTLAALALLTVGAVRYLTRSHDGSTIVSDIATHPAMAVAPEGAP
jgi:hypothetical protein